MPLTPFDRALVEVTRHGLPLVERPYEAVGAVLGVSGEAVRERLQALQAAGLMHGIAPVADPQRLGYGTEAMAVWDVDDAEVDRLGTVVGAMPGVARCSRRPRQGPDWPYNLMAELHGRSPAALERQALRIRCLLGPACRADDLLFTEAELKRSGLEPRA